MSVIDIDEKRRLRQAARALATPHIPPAENHTDAGKAQLQLWDHRDWLRGHNHTDGNCPVCAAHDTEAHKRDRIGHNLTCPRCVELHQAYVTALSRRRNA